MAASDTHEGELVFLSLEVICMDGRTQMRAKTNISIIKEYATAMRAGDRFPPVIVF